LEAILLHELAHIRRHDYLVNLIQTATETLLFYHPAVWWVSRRVRVEREYCCDDVAAVTCGNTLTYARALAELEQCRQPALRLALAASGGSLLQRIHRLTFFHLHTVCPSRLGRPRVILDSHLGLSFPRKGVCPMTKKPKNAESGRFSAKRKMEAVLRLLRGEDLELLSREYGVVAARLSQWREDFLSGGQLALQQRPVGLREEQIKDLQAKIGELTMANELLHHQIQRQASSRPFVAGRSRP
jgi:hypothetical protein